MEVDKDQQHQQKQQPVQRNLLASSSGPLLAYLHGKKGNRQTGKSQTFFSLSENRYQVQNIPEMREKRILVCSHGWLVLKDVKDDGEDCFLLNPISMQKIQLPPWVSKSKVPYLRCVLSSPPDDPNCVVMFIGLNFNILRFFFCKPRDFEWTGQDLELHDEELSMRTIGIHNGEIYMLGFFGKLYMLRIDEASKKVVFSDLEVDVGSFWEISFSQTYLVEICGELFRVDQAIFIDEVINIRVFKLDFDKKVWIKIIRMEDKAILLGSCGSALAYSTKESSGIRGNTIYFTLPDDRSLYMYDLDSTHIDVHLPCPNVKHNWSQPTWILALHDKDN